MTTVSSMGTFPLIEYCEICDVEVNEKGQTHCCGDCGDEIIPEQCEEWQGFCTACSYKIKNN